VLSRLSLRARLLLGVVVLGEHITASVALGLVLIVLGVAVINAPAKRRT